MVNTSRKNKCRICALLPDLARHTSGQAGPSSSEPEGVVAGTCVHPGRDFR